MQHLKAILDAILSKNVFEYILIDRSFQLVESSMGTLKYLTNIPMKGEDVREYFPELVGYEEEIVRIFEKKEPSFALETVEKSGFYFDLYVDYYDKEHVLILLHNVTALTQNKQKILQYGNEKNLLSAMLQKVIDTQESMLVVLSDTGEIVFCNNAFKRFFSPQESPSSCPSIQDDGGKAIDLMQLCKNNNETHVHIGGETFQAVVKRLDNAHILLTLLKVTELYNTKRELEAELKRDPLTKIYRKDTFESILKQWKQEGICFGVVVVDIDNFKQINDMYGHLVGDKVLKEFTDLLQSSLREEEVIARWGGEEFLIALRDDDVKQLNFRVEQMRKRVSSHRFDPVGTITASFGFSVLCDHGDTVDEAMWRADKALYEAKSAGKNCIRYRQKG